MTNDGVPTGSYQDGYEQGRRDESGLWKADREQLLALNKRLVEGLKKARDHLEYCGYGDNWERECAKEAGLPDLIDALLSEIKEK